jgi:putative acetyltransferase
MHTLSRGEVSARIKIIPALTPIQVARVRRLLREYEANIGIDLCFQNFQEEVRALPGEYARPVGALFLAEWGRRVAGCVALRPLGGDRCEIKRLYVRPKYRGFKIGRALAETVITKARQLGYRTMVLDTLRSMKPAISLYEAIGFQRTKAYGGVRRAGLVYMRLALDSWRAS